MNLSFFYQCLFLVVNCFFLGAVIDSVFWVDVRFLSALKVLHCSGVVVM